MAGSRESAATTGSLDLMAAGPYIGIFDPMGLRIVALLSATLAFAASFCVLAVGQLSVLGKFGLLNVPVGVLVVGASLVGSVSMFRAVHDWVVVRWSNEPGPFLFGQFDLDRRLRRWRRTL